MGIGEAGAYPCNAGIAAKWFPDKERGKVTALFDRWTKFERLLQCLLWLGWLLFLDGEYHLLYVD